MKCYPDAHAQPRDCHIPGIQPGAPQRRGNLFRSTKGANHTSLGQWPRSACAPPTRAEGPGHASGCTRNESGLRPFASFAPATWAVGPGWYEHGPLALKRTLGIVGDRKSPLALGCGWPRRTRSKAAEDCRTPGRWRAPSPRHTRGATSSGRCRSDGVRESNGDAVLQRCRAYGAASYGLNSSTYLGSPNNSSRTLRPEIATV